MENLWFKFSVSHFLSWSLRFLLKSVRDLDWASKALSRSEGRVAAEVREVEAVGQREVAEGPSVSVDLLSLRAFVAVKWEQ